MRQQRKTTSRVAPKAAKSADRAALLDRIEDLEARLAFLRTRGEESFPFEIAKRLRRGESPLRVFREYRGLTQQQLASACQISTPYLSEIEAGKKPGSIEVLARIARHLDVSIDDLVTPAAA